MKYTIAFIILLCPTLMFGQAFPLPIIQNHAVGPDPNPPLPVRDSLVAWFKADSTLGLTVSGDTSHVWPDVSGNDFDAFQLTDANKPEWYSAADSGQAMMVFDGVNDKFSNTVAGARVQPNTVIAVARTYTPTGTHTMTDGEAAQNAVFQNGTSWGMFAGTTLTGAGTPNIDSTYIVMAKFAGATSSLRVNGITVHGNANTAAGTGISLGGGTGAGFPFQGRIHEVIIYNSLLTDSEIVLVENYLALKWSVNLP